MCVEHDSTFVSGIDLGVSGALAVLSLSGALRVVRLFVDSRVVDLTRLYNAIFVTSSSWRSFFCNSLENA